MRYLTLRTLLVMLLALLALSIAAPPALAQDGKCQPSQADPNSNVNPGQGTTVTRFFFCAKGFGKEETVKLWVNAPDGGLISEENDLSNKYTTDSTKAGEAFWSWFPPQGWSLPHGTYTIVAYGLSSNVERVIRFEIIGTVEPPKSTLRDAQPEVALSGTVFRFWARGFNPSEKLEFIVRPEGGEPPQKNYDDYVGEVSAEGDGKVVWTWKSLTKMPDGTYEMSISGKDSRQTRTIPFAIGKPPLAAPSESGVNPKVGAPGASFAFFARGFSTEERVRLIMVYPDGTQKIDDAEAIPLDSGDPIQRVRADWSWTAPETAKPGAYVMVAEGEESGVTHNIPFEIR